MVWAFLKGLDKSCVIFFIFLFFSFSYNFLQEEFFFSQLMPKEETAVFAQIYRQQHV
jgi:hypothetical protein